MDNRPIGIFDSGIGGLTVLKRIIDILPNERYIYYADTANVPYGTKEKVEVKKYVKDGVKFLFSRNVKAIVIACNTATSIAIEDIRKMYDIPIIGIEPAVKPAIEKMGLKKVLVMATPITVREDKLNKLIRRLEIKDKVDLIPMPKLVEFAENGVFNSNEIKEYIKKELEGYNLEEYSELVLGCTHFPFFKKVLSKIFSNKIEIIDGGIGVAKRLKSLLQKDDALGSNNLEMDYYESGSKIEDKTKVNELLNMI